MQCPACRVVNNPGRVYCGGCARTIGVVCPVCLFVNEPADRYCGGCALDLLAAPHAPVPAQRGAAVGPAAPADAPTFVKPPVSLFAKGDQRGFPSDLEDLSDLAGGPVPGGPAAAPESAPADATQSAVDDFFQRLAREGVAEITPPAVPGQGPGLPRSVRS